MSKADESADRAERVIEEYSDAHVLQLDADQAEGLELDVSDVLADLRHLCDRYGVEWDDAVARGWRSYVGDVAEGGGTAPRRELDSWTRAS
jgi:hypothetical protein